MKRAIFLLGLCSALLLPAGAWADIAEPPKERQRRFEEQMRAEDRLAEQALAKVKVQGTTGGIELVFQLAGPGECGYALFGPQSKGAPKPAIARGNRSSEGIWDKVLEEKVVIAPEPRENVNFRYSLLARCRVKLVQQTNFGPKETGQVEEVNITHSFYLRRESVYHVTR